MKDFLEYRGQVDIYGSRDAIRKAFQLGLIDNDHLFSLKGAKLDLKSLNRISNALDDLLLPYTFDLSVFTQIENMDFIDLLEPMNIEARYPTNKEQLMTSLTEKRCVKILNNAQELQKWMGAEVIEKLKTYKQLLSKQMKFDEMILFGSYAKGNARVDSDVDVAIIVETLSGDYFFTRPLLWKIRREVDDRIEPVLIEKSHDESGFLAEIIKTGVII